MLVDWACELTETITIFSNFSSYVAINYCADWNTELVNNVDSFLEIVLRLGYENVERLHSSTTKTNKAGTDESLQTPACPATVNCFWIAKTNMTKTINLQATTYKVQLIRLTLNFP